SNGLFKLSQCCFFFSLPCILRPCILTSVADLVCPDYFLNSACTQGWTDHLETRALSEGPGCPWYLFHRFF
ncbi:unnamed protein product, partial [Staurois parvus]